jgi:hypothetical protein
LPETVQKTGLSLRGKPVRKEKYGEQDPAVVRTLVCFIHNIQFGTTKKSLYGIVS